MIILSEAASNAALNGIGALLNGGAIELLSAEGGTLAVLGLSNPAAKPAAGGELEFNTISEEDAAPANGAMTTARILAADGSEIFLCDVGNVVSDAVIQFATVQIKQGEPVRLSSFKLSMP